MNPTAVRPTRTPVGPRGGERQQGGGTGGPSPPPEFFLGFRVQNGGFLRRFRGEIRAVFSPFSGSLGWWISVGGARDYLGPVFGEVKLNIPPNFRAHRAGSRSRGVLVALFPKKWMP